MPNFPPLLVRFTALGFACGCLFVLAAHLWEGEAHAPIMTMEASLPPAVPPREITDLLFYGDSLTYGTSPPNGPFPYRSFVETLLRPSQPTLNFNHLGYPGVRAAELLSRANEENGLNARLSSFPDPKGVVMVLLIGTNDLGYSFRGSSSDQPVDVEAKAESITADITALHDLAAAKGIASVGVAIPTSRFVTKNTDAESVRVRINDQLERHCSSEAAASSNCIGFVPSVDYDDGEFCDDGLHYTEEGYERLGGRVADVIKIKIIDGD
jgi:lysophospholipase L1-like esterase